MVSRRGSEMSLDIRELAVVRCPRLQGRPGCISPYVPIVCCIERCHYFGAHLTSQSKIDCRYEEHP